MKYQEVIKELRSGKFRPIYFLMGEEPYFIDQVARYVEENALPEDQRSFNQSVLYGADVDVQTVVSEARRYPMMADRVVIVVREAQHLREIENLVTYAANPSPTTVLVICYKYKKLDKRKKLYKALSNAQVVMESKRFYDNHIPDWIRQRMHSEGYKITPKAQVLMAESLGTDLSRIDQEIEKLKLVVDSGSEITDDLVEQYIGISKEFNNFELVKALARCNFPQAFKIQQYFAANPKDNPLLLTTSILFSFFSKVMIVHQTRDRHPRAIASLLGVNSYFADDYITGARNYDIKKAGRIIGYLRDCDRKGKGVGNHSVPEGELLRELLFKIIYA